MHLLFLVSDRGPRGGFYSVVKFAEALARRGHSVALACVRYPIYLGGHKNSIQVKVRHQVPHLFRGCGRLDKLWSRIYDLLILSPFVRERKPDYIFGLQMEDAQRAVRLGRRYKVPVANFVFETPTWIEQTWKDFRRDPSFDNTWNQFRASLLLSHKIIVNSELLRAEAERWLGRKVDTVAQPGIDKDAADSVPDPRREHQVIYVGALEERKNIDKAIIALSKLRSIPRPRLVVCGKGELQARLKRLAQRLDVQCEFKGAVTDYEKWREIKRSLFMVFPTSFEGFGMPPAEALYCKIPCIASDLPILRDIYADKLEYFTPVQVEELADKMRFLLTHPDYRTQRGEEGHSYVRERLSWQKSAEEIERCVAFAE